MHEENIWIEKAFSQTEKNRMSLFLSQWAAGKKNRAIQKQGDKDQGNNRNRECSSEKENKSVPRGREFTQINMESYSPGLITEDGWLRNWIKVCQDE